MIKKAASLLSKEEMIGFLETYIDSTAIEKLVRLGVLKRKGTTSWYYVLKPDDVPQPIARIPDQVQRITKNGLVSVLWKFPSASDIKKAKDRLVQLRGE